MEYAQEFRINLGIPGSYDGFISSFLWNLHTEQTDFKAYTKSGKKTPHIMANVTLEKNTTTRI